MLLDYWAAMEIHFCSRKLQNLCNSKEETIRRWGALRAAVVRRRLKQLKAAKNLSVIKTLAGQGLRVLTGTGKGELALDAQYPLGVIFVPTLKNNLHAADGHMNLVRVSAITLLAITEYDGD
jgi:hypothetical protein